MPWTTAFGPVKVVVVPFVSVVEYVTVVMMGVTVGCGVGGRPRSGGRAPYFYRTVIVPSARISPLFPTVTLRSWSPFGSVTRIEPK